MLQLLTERFLEETASNNNSTGGNSTSSDGSSPPDQSGGSYEFVAFMLWYIFLVLCCVIPTCCAYRRRRLVEARLAEQQASMNRLQQSNLFILSNLHRARDSERLQAARLRLLKEELIKTTMTVTEQDLLVKDSTSIRNTASFDLEEGEFSNFLRLPKEGVNADRCVPAVCAICLSPYAPGDQVVWSTNEACQHAFHAHDCLIPWLAKKDEPKCPVCRQDFCPAVSLVEDPSAAEHSVSFSFNDYSASFFSVDTTGRVITLSATQLRSPTQQPSPTNMSSFQSSPSRLTSSPGEVEDAATGTGGEATVHDS